jgi:hypothetical protein
MIIVGVLLSTVCMSYFVYYILLALDLTCLILFFLIAKKLYFHRTSAVQFITRDYFPGASGGDWNAAHPGRRGQGSGGQGAEGHC